MSHCLTAQVEVQGEEHLYRGNHNFWADAETDSENESEYDGNVSDQNYEIPVDQCESQDRPATSTQA